jgi:hypothetical protein
MQTLERDISILIFVFERECDHDNDGKLFENFLHKIVQEEGFHLVTRGKACFIVCNLCGATMVTLFLLYHKLNLSE